MKLMKPIILMMTLGSVLVYAEINSKRSEFKYIQKEQVSNHTVKTFNDLTQRDVASVEKDRLPAVQYLALNQDNRKRINSEWEVMRIVSENGEEVFNAFENEGDKAVRVNFELIGTSVIQIDGEEGQVYYLSLLTERNTIALFKEYNGGYEILEARKVGGDESDSATFAPSTDGQASNIATDIQSTPATDPTLNAELILEKALNPTKTAEVLSGDAISGSATIRGGSIERLSVSLHRGTQNETNLEIQFAEINDGGQFETQSADESVTGIVTNNANEGFRIRFATGPLQGAMLNFVTEEAYEEMQVQRENNEYERLEAQESPIAEEIRDQQEEFQNQRAQVSNEKNQAATIAPEYRPEEDSDEYYEDEVQGQQSAQDEYKNEKQKEHEDEYEEEYAEDGEQGNKIQSEVAENGFEF